MFIYDQMVYDSPLFDQFKNTSMKYNLNSMLKFISDNNMEQAQWNDSVSGTESYGSLDLSEDIMAMNEQEFDFLFLVVNSTLEKMKNMNSYRKTSTCFCSRKVRAFGDIYKSQFHGILSLIVCTFGIVTNLLNIIVLSQKELSATPINRILTGLAVTDLLVMIEYVPFSIYVYFIHVSSKTNFTYTGSLFMLIHMHFSQLLHTISIFQTLALAVCRHVATRLPYKCTPTCNGNSCYISVVLAYILPVFIWAPSYFVYSICEVQILENQEIKKLYQLHLSKLAKERNNLIYALHFWMYSVCIKLLPCLILSVISYYLIGTLREATKRKQELKQKSAQYQTKKELKQCQSKEGKRMDRTAHMLVAVLLLFLITEFPQGILALLSGILGRCFFESCYAPYGEVMDILALLNGAINFILYCSMSRQFRVTFGQLFKPKNVLGKRVPPTNTDMQSTYV